MTMRTVRAPFHLGRLLLVSLLWTTTHAFTTSFYGSNRNQAQQKQQQKLKHGSNVQQNKRSFRSGSIARQLSLEDPWSELTDKMSERVANAVPGTGENLVEDVREILRDVSEIQWTQMLAPGPGITQVKAVLLSIFATYRALPLYAEIGVIVLPVMAVSTAILYYLSFPDEDFREGYEPYERGNYDPIQARVYYSKHPMLVLQRALQLFRISNKFIVNLLIDKYVFRDEESQRGKRAEELLELIQKAGPTAIKVGQALSVRPDLIPSEYAETLATLQDRVPPFPSDKARRLLQDEMGEQKFAKLQDVKFENGPVASASIGQVYRGFIDDTEVAVKIQRPNVLSEIALDLFIVREFAPYYQKITRSATDFQGLANEWGRGFIAELDYNTEAANTMRFNEEMKKRGMTTVTAPIVVENYSTNRVLVTEWVQGKRLDQSGTDDVPRLCSVALNAYLVMLLELQSLHCDPHP